MAQITLEYDARNAFAKKTIDYILSLGIFSINGKHQTSFEKSQEDIKRGRVFTAKNGKDLVNQCLK